MNGNSRQAAPHTHTPPPYHIFRVKDDCFLFDCSAYQFYQIDDLMHRILELCLSMPLQSARGVILAEGRYSPAEIERAMKEVDLVGCNGLFERPANYLPLKDICAQIDAAVLDGQIVDIHAMLAESCNLACKYCFGSTMLKNSSAGLMTEQTAKKVIDILMEQEPQEVTITLFGGEPLCNKPVIDFIMNYGREQAKLRGKTLQFSITTNATLLDDKIIDHIVKNNFALMVSLDGPRDVHDRQCPTKSGGRSYDMAASNIKKLMQYRSVGGRATMTHPMPNLKALIDFFEDFGFNIITIAPAQNRPGTETEADFTPEDHDELLRQQEELLPWMFERLITGDNPLYFPYSGIFSKIANGNIGKSGVMGCGGGTFVACADANGNLYQCAKLCGMENWRIGHIDDGVDMDKNKLIWKKYWQCIQPFCGSCWAFPICQGPCIWDCAKDDGSMSFYAGDCKYRKRNAEHAASLFCRCQNHADGE